MKIQHVKSARQRWDKDNNPKPPLVCELNSDHVIKPGMPYKHVKLHIRAPQRVRCDECPPWKIWELSDSLSAQLQRVAYDFGEGLNDVSCVEDVKELLENAANEVREVAEARRESAQNMEDGLGHPTAQSDEMNDEADQLESWADEIETATVPDMPEPEEQDCDTCDGTSRVDDQPCTQCEDGKITPDEPTEDQIGEWIGACRDDLTIVDEPPF